MNHKFLEMINQYISRILFVFLFSSSIFLGYGQSNIMPGISWGEFGDKPGQLKFPTMIAADKNNSLYVVDQHNHRIQKFDSAGNFISMWGKQGSGQGEFNY
ncbi:MAG TPA: hypothetical protein VF476_08585, partial [Chitinophagaceae bacterium]